MLRMCLCKIAQNVMNFEEIKTKRLLLRKFTQETFDTVFGNLSEKDQAQILGTKTQVDYLIEKKKYENGFTTFNKKILYFQLIDPNTKDIIGWAGFHTWYIDHNRAELGYGLFEESYKRSGLMTEALVPIIDYGFNEMNLNRIEAFVSPTNEASLRLMSNFDFVKEGHLRGHYFSNNRMEDSLVFSLLRSEYDN